MSIRRLLAIAVLLFSLTTTSAQPLQYPATRKGDVVDNYYGVQVADPYRWLEDLDSEETRAWVEAQNKLTFGYLEKIPQRKWLQKRLAELWNYPKYGVPFKRGGRYFYAKNDGLQNQSVYYMVNTLDDPNPQILLDPNKFSEDGTVALTTLAFSKDGKKLVYGTSASGSDWRTFRIRDIDSGEDLPEVLNWIKFSGASWRKDGQGFYYSRYDKPKEGDTYEQINKNQKLYYHRLNTTQDQDILIYARPDNPDLGFAARVTDDGRYLAITVWKGTDRRNRFHYIDLEAAPDSVVYLLDAFDAGYEFVGNSGHVFYFLTDRDAPNKRLIAVDIREPEQDMWRELIPESDAVLQQVRIINKKFVVHALSDVKSRLTIHDLDGRQLSEVKLPAPGSAGQISGESDDTEMFFAFTSFTYPTTIFRYDFITGRSEVFRAPEIDFDANQYETKQVFYPSKDGTRIPMFIIHKKGLPMDGSNPTYLYGYGGFNISLTPSFSISNLVWLEQGGIYAQPNLRGGGEYGEKWHQAGMLEKKQNVFDDFIAAAEFLIREGYTSTPKLAIGGASNGGLLTGACVTQRPDLFGAAIVAVGVLDMLRYHKFTIGWAWASEYGSADNPEHFKFLYKYSPLHNVRPGTAYPPVLITTADHDDRVVPGHSYKFAAAMQAKQAGDAPILIRIETKAGHGAGRPTSKIIESEADKWAFLMKVLDMPINVSSSKSTQ